MQTRRCKIYRGIAQSRLPAPVVSSFSQSERRMRSRDSQTYLRARENLSRHDGRYLQNAPAIDNDRRHARRSCYIEFLSCSARIAGSIWFPNERIRANFLCARCTDPVHAN